ncbi:MAG: methytransferase partner Trm112 [Halobacteriota archaeon]
MKRELLKILCCPVCKGPLLLEAQGEEAGEIIKGTFYCGVCSVYYPIDEGIPNLLPPELR